MSVSEELKIFQGLRKRIISLELDNQELRKEIISIQQKLFITDQRIGMMKRHLEEKIRKSKGEK